MKKFKLQSLFKITEKKGVLALGDSYQFKKMCPRNYLLWKNNTKTSRVFPADNGIAVRLSF